MALNVPRLGKISGILVWPVFQQASTALESHGLLLVETAAKCRTPKIVDAQQTTDQLPFARASNK